MPAQASELTQAAMAIAAVLGDLRGLPAWNSARAKFITHAGAWAAALGDRGAGGAVQV